MAAQASCSAALACGAASFRAPRTDAYLNVIVSYFNPQRYARRPQLHAELMARLAPLEASGRVRLFIVEAALPGQRYEVTRPEGPQHLQLRIPAPFFCKEALVNAAVARLLVGDPAPIAWMDGDLTFVNDAWVDDELAALAVHPIVQLFESAHDLGARGELHGTPSVSLGAAHQAWLREHAFSPLEPDAPPPPYVMGAHPGYVWAMTRDAWDALGGLFPYAVCGGGDRLMAAALLGYADAALPPGASPRYAAALKAWAAGAGDWGRSLGYVPGTVIHGFHGSKGKRSYKARMGIFEVTNYDPTRDTRTVDGVLQLAPSATELARRIGAYLASRDEDSRPLRDDAPPANGRAPAGKKKKRKREADEASPPSS